MAVGSIRAEVARQDLIFKSALVLQRPVLDPCLAVGFLPLPSAGLRVGQLVTMKWRIERLKGFGGDETSENSVSYQPFFLFSLMLFGLTQYTRRGKAIFVFLLLFSPVYLWKALVSSL